MLQPSNDDSNLNQTQFLRDTNKSPSLAAMERRRGSLFRLDIRPSIRLQPTPATMEILPATERRASVTNADLQEVISTIIDFEDKTQVWQAIKGLSNMKDKLKTLDIILEERRKAKQKRFRRKVAKATTISSLTKPRTITDKGPTATNIVNQFRKKLMLVELEFPANEETPKTSRFLELISQQEESPKPKRSRLGLLSQIKREDSNPTQNQDDSDESVKLVFPIEDKQKQSPKLLKQLSPKIFPKNIRDAFQNNDSSPMQRLKMKNLTSITELAERKTPARSATLRKRSSKLTLIETPDRSPRRKVSLVGSVDSQGELGPESPLRRSSIRKISVLDSPLLRNQIKRNSIRASALLKSRMQKDLRIESPSLKSQVNDLHADSLSQSQPSSARDLSPGLSLPRKSILKNFESLPGGRNIPPEVGTLVSPLASTARGGFTSRFIRENPESRPTTEAQTSRSTTGRKKSLIPKPPKNAIREETYQLAGKELQDNLYRYLLNNENHIVNQAVVKSGKVTHKKMRNIEREAFGKFEEFTHQENIVQQETARHGKFRRTEGRAASSYVNTAPTTRENSQMSSPRDFRISAIRTSSFVRLVPPKDLQVEAKTKEENKKPKRAVMDTLGSYTEIQLDELYKKSRKTAEGIEKISNKLANSNSTEERKILNKARDLKIRDLSDSSKKIKNLIGRKILGKKSF